MSSDSDRFLLYVDVAAYGLIHMMIATYVLQLGLCK